ncbi:hypothetical protein AKJ16_DCAP18519 [Drosera capensis]
MESIICRVGKSLSGREKAILPPDRSKARRSLLHKRCTESGTTCCPLPQQGPESKTPDELSCGSPETFAKHEGHG